MQAWSTLSIKQLDYVVNTMVVCSWPRLGLVIAQSIKHIPCKELQNFHAK